MIDAILSIFLHLDQLLPAVFNDYGSWIYLILFLVIFCETGLVFTPFLPGDSLLFAAGALTATSELSVFGLWGILLVAAIAGDAVNYKVGRFFGKQVSKSRFINQKHLEKAHTYFEEYGGKAIILGRFLPIVRTFVPFLAGMSEMSSARFFTYNVVGALIWVTSFLFTGYLFGQLSFVKTHFSSIILGIMVVSFLPIVIDAVRCKFKR